MKTNLVFIISLINIPLKLAPIEAILIIIQKIFSGIAPTLEIMCIGFFLNTSISIISGVNKFNKIFLAIIFLVLIIGINSISEKLIDLVSAKLKLKLKLKYKNDIISKIAKLKYSYIENKKSWDIISRISKDPEEMLCKAFLNVLNIFTLTIRILGVLSILFFYSKISSFIICIFSFPLFIIAIKNGRSMYTVIKEVSQERRKSDYLGLVLTNREFVDERTLFSYGEELSDKWVEIYEKVRKLQYNIKLKWFRKSQIGSILVSIISISILFLFLKPLSEKELTIGLFISLTYGIINLVEYMSWRLVELVKALAKDKEYFHDFKEFFSFDEEEGAMELPSNNINLKTIEFKNVSFKYPETDRNAIENLSFKIEVGKHYAIVGSNGSGKTTITKLIAGLYDEFDGDILINNKSIKEYKKCEIKGLSSIVYQDFARYPLSIKDNISIGNIKKINDKELEKNIKSTIKYLKLNEKIDKLEDGLNQKLGKLSDESIDLSGGQWQKIAMARIIVNDSDLRILDEPTSSLDPISECTIYENFEQISRNKTTIFISHRLGSIKLADEIIVLNNGKLVGIGSHNHLMRTCKLYKKMYNKQREWYLC